VATDPAGRQLRVAGEQRGDHRRLGRAGDQPHDPAGPVHERRGQRHAQSAVEGPDDGDVVGGVDDRVAGGPGGRVAVVAEAEVDDVDPSLRADHRPDLLRVGGRPRFHVGFFDRHRMHVGRRDRHPVEQRLLQAGQVAVGMTGRRDPLVDLEDVHGVPRQVARRQFGEERPRAASPAHGQRRPPPGSDRPGQPGGHLVGGPPGQGGLVGQDFHVDLAHPRIITPNAPSGLTRI
jgi:hypothetical protein